jgi:hypothetical protein
MSLARSSEQADQSSCDLIKDDTLILFNCEQIPCLIIFHSSNVKPVINVIVGEVLGPYRLGC